jgi:hypothetical protein
MGSAFLVSGMMWYSEMIPSFTAYDWLMVPIPRRKPD